MGAFRQNVRWNRLWGGAKSWVRMSVRDTRAGWREAFGLLRRGVQRSLLVIAVLSALPTLLDQWSQLQSAANAAAGSPLVASAVQGQASYLPGVLSLIQSLLLTPLMYALLARVQLTQLRGGTQATLLEIGREKLTQWKTLLMLAAACLFISRLVAFVPSVVSGILSLMLALVGWIPVLGQVLGVVLSLILQVVIIFASLAMGRGIYFVWLAQEAQGGAPLMWTLASAWRFIRQNLYAVVGGLMTLTLGQLVWLLLELYVLPLAVSGIVLMALDAVVQVVITLLFTVYATALYGGGQLYSAHTYGQPTDFENMKRANPS